MPLRYLDCNNTRIRDLSPLEGMPLTYLACGATYVSDLSTVRDMQLSHLGCDYTHVADFSPLKLLPLNSLAFDMPLFDPAAEELIRSLKLTQINSHDIQFPDMSAFWTHLETNRQAALEFAKTASALPPEDQVETVLTKLKQFNGGISDDALECVVHDNAVVEVTLKSAHNTIHLSPLMAFTGLKKFTLVGEPFWPDLSCLMHVPLEELKCRDEMITRNSTVLRNVATLKTINGKPAAEFWQQVEARNAEPRK
jgi:hypothetical protein